MSTQPAGGASPGYEALSNTLVASDTLELQAHGEDLDAIVRMLPLHGVRRVLDVGCGSGALTRAIARHAGDNVDVWGADLTGEHVERARALAASCGLANVRYVLGDIFDASKGLRGTFDLVCEKYVLMTMLPRRVGRSFIARMKERTASGGSIALVEADINFGADRHPPAPEPLAAVLRTIVDYYRRHDLIEWRCGLQIYEYLKHAGLKNIRVRVADGRVIQGGSPRALVEHANTDVEQLIEPCLEEMGIAHMVELVARQWREYLESDAHFTYNPIFVGSGIVHHG